MHFELEGRSHLSCLLTLCDPTTQHTDRPRPFPLLHMLCPPLSCSQVQRIMSQNTPSLARIMAAEQGIPLEGEDDIDPRR
jgi:hypothetical protein